jgi:hypothetical protein
MDGSAQRHLAEDPAGHGSPLVRAVDAAGIRVDPLLTAPGARGIERRSHNGMGMALTEAAQRSGVQCRISRGRIRVTRPAGTETLTRALFIHEAHIVAALGPEWGTGGHGVAYDSKVTYLTVDQLERCRRVRDRLRAAREHVAT